jgi:chromosome segregation ATPase
MSSSVAKDIYESLKKIITVEDRIAQLAESMKRADMVMQNHAERIARLEGKFELLEHTLASPRRRLPGRSSSPVD